MYRTGTLNDQLQMAFFPPITLLFVVRNAWAFHHLLVQKVIRQNDHMMLQGSTCWNAISGGWNINSSIHNFSGRSQMHRLAIAQSREPVLWSMHWLLYQLWEDFYFYFFKKTVAGEEKGDE